MRIIKAFDQATKLRACNQGRTSGTLAPTSELMIKLAEACERIAGTTKKLEKIAIVADYLKSRTPEEASVSAVFLSGRPFPVWEETTLQVGGRVLWRIVAELSGKSEAELTAAYRKLGDLGAVAEAVSRRPAHSPRGDGRPARPGRAKPGSAALSVPDVAAKFREIAAARGPAAKAALTRELLVAGHASRSQVHRQDHDWRSAHRPEREPGGRSHRQSLRRNVARGAAGQHAAGRHWRDAEAGGGRTSLADAKMRLFHPLGFMLASPAESAEEALSYFENALVEDKYDGIRAQAHCSGGEVRIFSRTRDEITESFPELPDALAGLPEDVILDGEIVAWSTTKQRRAPESCRSAGVPPAGGSENERRNGPGAPLQRAAAAPGTKASQREADAAGAGRVSRLRCSLRRGRVAAGASSPRARENSRCPAGGAEEISQRHELLAGKQARFEFGDDVERLAHARDSRARISRVNAAGTRSTV